MGDYDPNGIGTAQGVFGKGKNAQGGGCDLQHATAVERGVRVRPSPGPAPQLRSVEITMTRPARGNVGAESRRPRRCSPYHC